VKTAFIFFLLGAIAGGVSLYIYKDSPAITAENTAPSAAPAKSGQTSLADKARETAADARDSITRKLEDWDLDTGAIKRDLARGGEVVRSKAKVAGEKIADARIITVIKAKYVVERDLSAMDIRVDCRDGEVTLAGTVTTAENLGRAVALALDTDGVHNVISKVTLATK
jgi:osmotically-inducible protein OsmY